MGMVLTQLLPGLSFANWPNGFRADRVELRTGYGWQYTNNSRPNNFQITPILSSVIYQMTDPVGPAWFRGRFLWNPELFIVLFSHPYVRSMVGVTPIQFQYSMEPIGRFSPYFLIGAGVLRAHINRRETRAHTNFNLQGGIGTRYALTQITSLIFEYRHIHVSNAGLHEDNAGLNTHTFLVGISVKR